MYFVFAKIFLRYFIIASIFYLFFWVFQKRKGQHRKIQNVPPDPKRMRSEFLWSVSSCGVFTLTSFLVGYLKIKGLSSIYINISAFGWIYFILSVPLLMLIIDSYAYWIHRFLHLPGVYQTIHKIHHDSIDPSPWATFCVHPVEAIMRASFVVLLSCIIPLHPLAITIVLFIRTIAQSINHLGYEFFPVWFSQNWLGRWFSTSTYHNMHHTHIDCHFSVFFNWWDRLMGTHHPDYDNLFIEVTTRQPSDALNYDRS